MGLFDRFRKPRPEPEAGVPLSQLCYDVAYFILPHYAHNEPDRVAELCRDTPAAAGPFFYLMACQVRQVEPVVADAKRFQWHLGPLDEGRDYFALEYPTPPPVDFSGLSLEEVAAADPPLVLAPYFSAIIRQAAAGSTSYFILGQTSMGGGTTLRFILPEGGNCNLGPGPEPRLDDFLDAIRARVAP